VPGGSEDDGILDDGTAGAQRLRTIGQRCAGRHDIVDQHNANATENVIRSACEPVARRESCRARPAALRIACTMP